MSDTYNENEIVKLKHLNEFARQLNIKLDGGTDPKSQIPITKLDFTTQKGVVTFTIENPTVNFTFASFDASTKSVQLRMTMPYLPVAPILSFSNDEWIVRYARYGMLDGVGMPSYMWSLSICTTADSLQPQSFVMHIHFDETTQYAAFDLDVIINITED